MTAVNDRLDVAANIVPIPSKIPAWQRGYSRRLVMLDFVGVVLAVGLAQWGRFGGLAGEVSTYRYLDYAMVSVALIALWMAALAINHSRSTRVIGSGVEEYRRVWLATLSVRRVSAMWRQSSLGYRRIKTPPCLGRWSAGREKSQGRGRVAMRSIASKPGRGSSKALLTSSRVGRQFSHIGRQDIHLVSPLAHVRHAAAERYT